MTSGFQPLNEGINALEKKAYSHYMIARLTTAVRASDIIKIFDAVLNTKVAWESAPDPTIQSA